MRQTLHRSESIIRSLSLSLCLKNVCNILIIVEKHYGGTENFSLKSRLLKEEWKESNLLKTLIYEHTLDNDHLQYTA